MVKTRSTLLVSVTSLAFLALAACGRPEVSSDEQARRAYLGIDSAIEKSLKLGFAGFNAASSANIPPQSAPGDSTGLLTVSGQVDQGASANKGMRLRVGMVDYSDGEITLEDEDPINIAYATSPQVDTQPALNLSLRDIPNGTFTGTLMGDFQMTGDLEDKATLNLTFGGQIEEDATGAVRRKAGTTTVTGTVTSGSGGTYQVDVKI